MRLTRILFVLLLLSSCWIKLQAQSDYINWKKPNAWVDSVYATMSENERIAQLMMVAAWSSKDSAHIKEIECHIRELKVGGIIFFKGTPVKQALLTNYYQSISKIPLIVGIDGEWGVSMRLDSVPVYPRQMIMGAARNETEVYEFGRRVGKECRRLGIHYNFAPDVDVNNNPDNPVINDRSFGEDRNWVAKLGGQYARGLQDEKVLASAKHFPGHGDVSSDSHFSLPVVTGNRKRLDSLELFPFRELIKDNVTSIMVAHLNVPALDSASNTPSSLSKPIITDLLKKEMGFDGIIITDALNMKGVTDFCPPGEVAAKALAAGSDILLFVEDMTQSIDKIKEYIARGEITWSQIEYSCKKILKAKYWLGLNQYKPLRTEGLIEDLNCCEADLVIKNIVKNGIVVAKNEDHIIPIENPELYKIATVAVGISDLTTFQQTSMDYIHSDYFSIDKSEAPGYFDSLYNKLNDYNLLIVSLHNTSRYVAKRLGLTQLEIDFINRLSQSSKKVIFVCNGNPYILRNFSGLRNVIVSFEDLDVYNNLSAQILFGAVPSKGHMPVTVNSEYPLGSGIATETLERFAYDYPQEIGIDNNLSTIDTIVNDAILKKAMPGCQVLVAKDGKVIYQKAFGYQTYDSAVKVTNYHVYDLASLTKMLATTLAMMHLYDEGKIKLDQTLGYYLPMVRGSNKEDLIIRDVMMHQAGLIPFIPIYKQTLVNGKPNPLIYSDSADENYTIPVAQNLYMHKTYEAYVWDVILDSDLKHHGDYVYSDLGFILLKKLVEEVSGLDFESYLQKNIYTPLNLSMLCFNPLNKINNQWIVPTENDTLFRQQLLRGTVHDQTAALLGGVSGHAGLFGNSNDVAIIMQMLLNGGEYGGKRILKESTVKEFTKKHSKTNRRGYGFDKPETDPHKGSPVGKDVSPLAFGHTGFTGTCAWVDPKYNLVYVFLSNRINPSAENKKLVEMNVRTRIQDYLYEVIKKQ